MTAIAGTMKPLLLEIGTEELPVKALPGLAQALFDGVVAGLAKRGIAADAGAGRPLYTPRRLAVLLPAVAVAQAEQRSEVLGPYLDIALDGDGQPTRALQGFAQKAGVDWTALERLTDGRGERFVHRAVRPGVATTDLLQDIVREAVAAMPIPRPMRWGAHEHAFARPVHWLVLLLGGDVVEAKLFGIRGDRMSRGHRFMHDKPVWIGNPGDYVDALRAAKVLVDPVERRARILHQVEAAATAAGGVAHVDDDNLAQVNCLVEWPHAVACSFEPVFLEVPPEALVETMQANQKFFPVHDAGGALSEHFIGVANVAPVDSSEIRRGYERVIRPRFADARFFFVEDLKQGLASMGEGLASVTYQAKLGTIADKARRVATLAESIAPTLAVEPGLARRAAELSKADLQSRLVNEFPELQGIAGRHYALRDAALQDLDDARRRDVAVAIDEAYMPRFAGDAIAPSPLGRALAIAERADTLAGGFAAGLKPTGNKDPFALRRTALGLARTIIESGVELDLWLLLGEARLQASQAMGRAAVEAKQAAVERARAGGATISDSQEAISSTAPADVDELFDFVLERMRGYYEARGFTELQFAAVLARRPRMLHDFDQRLKAVAGFARLPEAEALAAADKRIRNILRKAGGDVPATVDTALLAEAAERDLHDAVEQAIADTDPALAAGDYVAVLGRMARLRPQVDAFFDAVMVNVDDAALRGNRLALLQRLSARLGAVAAIEHLSA